MLGMAYIIFNISIGICIDNRNNENVRYSYSENSNKDAPLLLLSYHNNSHFDTLYYVSKKN